MRIELPAEQWAEILEPKDLRSADFKAYRSMVPIGVGLTLGLMDQMKDQLLRRVITNWSIELPLPKDHPGSANEPGSLDMLDIATYKALTESITPHLELIDADDPDPKPSPESAGTSKASE